jgi:serine/threonine-protein kinase
MLLGFADQRAIARRSARCPVLFGALENSGAPAASLGKTQTSHDWPQVLWRFAVFWQGLARSVHPTPAQREPMQAAQRFSAQLELARIHPALVPMREDNGGYVLDAAAASGWVALTSSRGLAGYGLSRALRILLDLLAGLTALHETQTEAGAGFVHGELSPAFVRVDQQGIARLVPLAPWHFRADSAPLPEHLGHVAPERLLGDAIDRRADVFSAGVLLWEALAGRRLFEDHSVDQIVVRLLGGKIQVPALPPELSWAIPLKAVAMRALSVDPEQRFADCPELAFAIEAVTRGRVASHAQVAAHFALRERSPSSLPPRLPGVPVFEQEFRSSHKSSLSALVAPRLSVTPSPSELESAPEARPPRRTAWTASALVSVLVALTVVALTRHNQTFTAAQQVSPGAAPAVLEPAPSQLAPAAAAAPSAAELDAPPAQTAPADAAPALAESGAKSRARDRTSRTLHPSAPPSGSKAQAKSSKAVPASLASAAVAAPVPAAAPDPAPAPSAAPAPKPPRARDNEAEQYGI